MDSRTQTDPHRDDSQWMSRAIDLAEKAVGLASPNPSIGCVIVSNGKVVGEGFHDYDKRDHAEVVALRMAGAAARGATAYVTLEPCSHVGRTGPCADALIAAGISRVVAATADPNPLVQGRGLAKLRKAGVDVASGVGERPARRLNDAFAKFIRTGRPHVTLKAAMTLDGRLTSRPSKRTPGKVEWITGPRSRQHVQVLRHSVDAVLTGIGTVLADDPELTDRSGLARRRPLLRVVLDSQLRLPLESKLAHQSKQDLLVFCSNPKKDRLQAVAAAGVTVVDLPPASGTKHPPLGEVLRELGSRQITSLMIEAGARVNTEFLQARLVDRLFLFYAPYFLGSEGMPILDAADSVTPTLQEITLHRFDPDFAAEARLADHWQ